MGVTSAADRFEVLLPPQPPSVAEARRFVRQLLVAADRADLIDTCILLVSEIVTNALLHAGTEIELRAALDGSGLRVDVGDGSVHLPSRRRYAATAGTGRGLQMLESMVDDWGVTRHGRGKTVWFVISSADKAMGLVAQDAVRQSDGGPTQVHGGSVPVQLQNMPLLLHAAWQEHTEALLRELLLASLDSEGDDPIQMHAEATDAIAVLEEHVPRIGVQLTPDELMVDAAEPSVSAAVIEVPVPLSSVPHFETLDRAVEAALELAHQGTVLTPPSQPEVQAFRRWMCGQVLAQAAGSRPRPWSVPTDAQLHPDRPLDWDPATVTEAAHGIIAANTASQIIAVSAEAARILGYDDPADLVGRRIVSIVPARLRQAHVAGFTMFLLVGRRPIMRQQVVVPALRRDGTEVDVELVVRDHGLGEGHSVLLADIRLAGEQPTRR